MCSYREHYCPHCNTHSPKYDAAWWFGGRDKKTVDDYFITLAKKNFPDIFKDDDEIQ